MSYRVFARKYRPQIFEEVVGQEHITRTLQNAIRENRVAQAYMFVGPRGIGKTSTARILAKALNCSGGPTANPCGTCDSCIEIAEGRNLDVLEIDGASNNGVENIRDLRESAAYSPARGPFKIYLIDEVHMLSAGAFNALLKTLEEPPPHVKFIFATTEAQKVPATITSRCQRFDLRRIAADDIATHLGTIATAEKISLDPEAAAAIARAAEGGLRDAESMLDQAVAFCGNSITRDGVMEIFGFTPRETVSGLAGAILERDAGAALAIVTAQSEAGKDLSRFLGDVAAHLRDLLVQGVSSDAPARRHQLLTLLDHFAEAEAQMRWAPDKKLQFDVAVIKAVHLLGQASLDEILDNLAALRSGEAPSPRPASPPRKNPPAPSTQKAPPPPPKPAPTQASPVEQESIDASVAWERVATEFGKSFIYRWLANGVFAGQHGPEIRVNLPESSRENADSIVGERGRKEAESKLTALLGKQVKFVMAIDSTIPEAIEEPPAAVEEPPPAAPEPAPADPAESFKNDPLIRLAVEKFRAEIRP